MVRRNLSLSLFCIILLAALSCSKEDSRMENIAPIHISFRLLHNGHPLSVSDPYLNFSGETYMISKFKFYISNLKLISNVEAAEKESYHLVDFETPSSTEIVAELKKGIYSSIEFQVGVDSIRNVSGAQTGALDPLNGMFWTWNTGYIFAKLEGHSSTSPAPSQAFTYHIGGFKTGENAIRKVNLGFPSNSPVNVGRTSSIVIDVDLAQWFDGVHTISIAANPSIMTPGGVSLLIADNYATMFTIGKVNNP